MNGGDTRTNIIATSWLELGVSFRRNGLEAMVLIMGQVVYERGTARHGIGMVYRRGRGMAAMGGHGK